jgi:starvation-inducible DNA-binding protein
MQPAHNTLSETIRTQAVELLNRHLAMAINLDGQLKQVHWNVRGPASIAFHELSDKVAGEADAYSDLIADHAAGLGGVAEGTVRAATERSFLIPYPLCIREESRHMFAVATTLAAFGPSASEAIGQSAAIGDADASDLFTEISRGVDHQLWLVESHVASK